MIIFTVITPSCYLISQSDSSSNSKLFRSIWNELNKIVSLAFHIIYVLSFTRWGFELYFWWNFSYRNSNPHGLYAVWYSGIYKLHYTEMKHFSVQRAFEACNMLCSAHVISSCTVFDSFENKLKRNDGWTTQNSVAWKDVRRRHQRKQMTPIDLCSVVGCVYVCVHHTSINVNSIKWRHSFHSILNDTRYRWHQ